MCRQKHFAFEAAIWKRLRTAILTRGLLCWMCGREHLLTGTRIVVVEDPLSFRAKYVRATQTHYFTACKVASEWWYLVGVGTVHRKCAVISLCMGVRE